MRKIILGIVLMLQTFVYAGDISLKNLLQHRIEVASHITTLYQKGEKDKLQRLLKQLKQEDRTLRALPLKTKDLREYLLFAQYCLEDIQEAAKEPPTKANVRYMRELEEALRGTDRYIMNQL